MNASFNIKLSFIAIWGIATLLSCACRKCKPTTRASIICNTHSDSTYKTKATKFIIIIQDGVRYSEGFGDSSFQNIPILKQISSKGSLFTNFYNNGATNTINGCCTTITGSYTSLANNTTAKPISPSILNYYLYCSGLPIMKAGIISSKDKIETLASYSTSETPMPIPYSDCGVNGNNTGYRHDTITFSKAKTYISQNQPNFLYITFREPDFSGHTGDWANYLKGIKLTDSLIGELYNYTQTIEEYKDKTNFFVTNDHGRHSDSFGGFSHHGDNCDGCKHISLLAWGPDIKENYTINKPYEQIDISKTIAYLLHLNMKSSQGKVMTDMLK